MLQFNAASASWCRLFEQESWFASDRIFCTAGSSMPMRMPMMAMTTSSSTNVKARRLLMRDRGTGHLLGKTGRPGWVGNGRLQTMGHYLHKILPQAYRGPDCESRI